MKYNDVRPEKFDCHFTLKMKGGKKISIGELCERQAIDIKDPAVVESLLCEGWYYQLQPQLDEDHSVTVGNPVTDECARCWKSPDLFQDLCGDEILREKLMGLQWLGLSMYQDEGAFDGRNHVLVLVQRDGKASRIGSCMVSGRATEIWTKKRMTLELV